MAHYIGKDPTPSTPTGKQPSPHPSPLNREGAGLAVLQFVALIRGEIAVHKPANPFRVVSVRAVEYYCLKCYGVRWFDVVEGTPLSATPLSLSTATSPQIPLRGYLGGVKAARCRCCGAEVKG